MNINNRIAQIIKAQGVSNNQFAKKCGIKNTSLQNYLNGRSKPGFEQIEKILKTYPHIDANWLIKGGEGFEGLEEMLSKMDALDQIEKLIIELRQ